MEIVFIRWEGLTQKVNFSNYAIFHTFFSFDEKKNIKLSMQMKFIRLAL